jgi:hypothetical protein
VFISWSGDLSGKLAQILRQWFPSVLQFVKPYYTPEDIAKGARWSSEIAIELKNSDLGVICLTKDNIEKPWILFEAGALSNRFDESKVCTLLFDLEPTDLKPPLSSFQATKFNKEDFKKLIVTINRIEGDNKLDESALDEAFEMWWPTLDKKVNDVLASEGSPKVITERSEKDLLVEILELSRSINQHLQRDIHSRGSVLQSMSEHPIMDVKKSPLAAAFVNVNRDTILGNLTEQERQKIKSSVLRSILEGPVFLSADDQWSPPENLVDLPDKSQKE